MFRSTSVLQVSPYVHSGGGAALSAGPRGSVTRMRNSTMTFEDFLLRLQRSTPSQARQSFYQSIELYKQRPEMLTSTILQLPWEHGLTLLGAAYTGLKNVEVDSYRAALAMVVKANSQRQLTRTSEEQQQSCNDSTLSSSTHAVSWKVGCRVLAEAAESFGKENLPAVMYLSASRACAGQRAWQGALGVLKLADKAGQTSMDLLLAAAQANAIPSSSSRISSSSSSSSSSTLTSSSPVSSLTTNRLLSSGGTQMERIRPEPWENALRLLGYAQRHLAEASLAVAEVAPKALLPTKEKLPPSRKGGWSKNKDKGAKKNKKNVAAADAEREDSRKVLVDADQLELRGSMQRRMEADLELYGAPMRQDAAAVAKMDRARGCSAVLQDVLSSVPWEQALHLLGTMGHDSPMHRLLCLGTEGLADRRALALVLGRTTLPWLRASELFAQVSGSTIDQDQHPLLGGGSGGLSAEKKTVRSAALNVIKAIPDYATAFDFACNAQYQQQQQQHNVAAKPSSPTSGSNNGGGMNWDSLGISGEGGRSTLTSSSSSSSVAMRRWYSMNDQEVQAALLQVAAKDVGTYWQEALRHLNAVSSGALWDPTVGSAPGVVGPDGAAGGVEGSGGSSLALSTGIVQGSTVFMDKEKRALLEGGGALLSQGQRSQLLLRLFHLGHLLQQINVASMFAVRKQTISSGALQSVLQSCVLLSEQQQRRQQQQQNNVDNDPTRFVSHWRSALSLWRQLHPSTGNADEGRGNIVRRSLHPTTGGAHTTASRLPSLHTSSSSSAGTSRAGTPVMSTHDKELAMTHSELTHFLHLAALQQEPMAGLKLLRMAKESGGGGLRLRHEREIEALFFCLQYSRGTEALSLVLEVMKSGSTSAQRLKLEAPRPGGGRSSAYSGPSEPPSPPHGGQGSSSPPPWCEGGLFGGVEQGVPLVPLLWAVADRLSADAQDPEVGLRLKKAFVRGLREEGVIPTFGMGLTSSKPQA